MQKYTCNIHIAIFTSLLFFYIFLFIFFTNKPLIAYALNVYFDWSINLLIKREILNKHISNKLNRKLWNLLKFTSVQYISTKIRQSIPLKEIMAKHQSFFIQNQTNPKIRTYVHIYTIHVVLLTYMNTCVLACLIQFL